MQANVITLAVDELNTESTTDHVYSRFEEFANRSVYTEAAHQLTARDTLALYRTFPKTNGNFPGTAKSMAKFSQDLGITGVDGLATLTSPLIGGISFSVPVGVDAAAQMVMRQRMIALLDDDTVMVALMNQLMV
jgi:hypothetical protein